MRIENIGVPQNVSEKAKAATLSQGDVLIAEVTAIDTDAVELKTSDGMKLTAKLLADIGVQVGDFVETVVDAADGGRYVLRIVDITRGGADMESLLLGGQKRGTVAANVLSGMLAMLKISPGTAPKAAVFLSQNGLSGSAENLQTLSQIVKGGEMIGKLLGEVANLQTMSAKDMSHAAEGKALATAEKQPLTQNTFFQSEPAVQSAKDAVYERIVIQKEVPTATLTQEGNAPVVIAENKDGANILAAKAAAQPVSADSVKSVEMPAAGMALEQLSDALQKSSAGEQPAAAESPPVPKPPTDGEGVNQPVSGDLMDASKAPPAGVVTDTKAPPGSAMPMHDAATDSVTAKTPGQETVLPAGQEALLEGVQGKMQTPQQTQSQPVSTAPQTADETTVNVAAGQDPAASVDKTTAVDELIAPKTEGRPDSLVQKAISLFVRLDEPGDVAGQIKKAVEELPWQLKELKILMERTDTMNKGWLEPAQQQAELLSQIKRFDCYHIPLILQNNEPATAELYVYRQRSKKTAKDSENIVILLGLDTQHMGRVETVVKADGSNLGIDIYMEDIRLKEETKGDAAVLREAAQRLGYTNVTVSVQKLAARTTLLSAEQKLQANKAGSEGSVDIRI